MENHNIKKLIVTQSNRLIEASYRLRLDEKRLILAAVSKVNSYNEVPSEITITAQEYGEMFGLDQSNSYSQLNAATDQLYERDIRITDPEMAKRVRMRWVQSVTYEDNKGQVTLEFATKIKPYLGQLKSHFTSYKLTEVKHFSSGHSIRLYELLMQFKKTGVREVDVDWLREYFGVENHQYKLFHEFKRRVLGIAMKEINTKSNIKVEWKPIKQGRVIHKIRFNFYEKQQKELF